MICCLKNTLNQINNGKKNDCVCKDRQSKKEKKRRSRKNKDVKTKKINKLSKIKSWTRSLNVDNVKSCLLNFIIILIILYIYIIIILYNKLY